MTPEMATEIAMRFRDAGAKSMRGGGLAIAGNAGDTDDFAGLEIEVDAATADALEVQAAVRGVSVSELLDQMLAAEELPADLWIHQAVLAYASDYGLLTTALQPHGVPFRSPRLQIASLDHSLWMHRPFRADEWLLYATDSPVSGGARGFVRGSIFTRTGELVASVAQEGLLRVRSADHSQ